MRQAASEIVAERAAPRTATSFGRDVSDVTRARQTESNLKSIMDEHLPVVEPEPTPLDVLREPKQIGAGEPAAAAAEPAPAWAQVSPETFSRDYVVHADTRAGANGRVESMLRGPVTGMAEVENPASSLAPWAERSPGTQFYVFRKSDVKPNGWLKEGAVPVSRAVIQTPGQSVLSALQAGTESPLQASVPRRARQYRPRCQSCGSYRERLLLPPSRWERSRCARSTLRARRWRRRPGNSGGRSGRHGARWHGRTYRGCSRRGGRVGPAAGSERRPQRVCKPEDRGVDDAG